MPVFSDGQKISAALAWDRMIQSVPASYVIWKDGTTYRAECLIKGGTDYSGTDAATVINNAINATTNGSIFIKKAEYICSSGIDVLNKTNFAMFAEPGATLKKTANFSDALYSGYPLLTIEGCANVHLSGLTLDGNSSGQNNLDHYELEIQNSNKVWVDNVHIKNPYYIGLVVSSAKGDCKQIFFDNIEVEGTIVKTNGSLVYFSNTAYPIYITNSYFHDTNNQAIYSNSGILSIDNCVFYNCAQSASTTVAVDFRSTMTAGVINDCTFYGTLQNVAIGTTCTGTVISNCYIQDCIGNQMIDVGGSDVTINNCFLQGNATVNKGISLHYGNNHRVANCTLKDFTKAANNGIALGVHGTGGHKIINNIISGSTFGIWMEGPTVKNYLVSNLFTGNTTDIKIISGEFDYFMNDGYVTEKSGTATISNGTSSVVVTHDLAGTPTNVRVSGTHSEVANLYVDSVTSTQFTIHAKDGNVTADRTVYWYAEYKP